LICQLLAAQNGEEARRAARAVEAFVGSDAERRLQLRRVCQALGEGRTSVGEIAATTYLQRWQSPKEDSGRPDQSP
jgi:hypothetical protein